MKQDEHHLSGTTRLEAFSDGVFAIAITLLVLELIQILHLNTGEGLLKTFLHHWEPFLAFLIGFMTILICWINHNHALKYITRVDVPFMWINGLLLFMVTLTPFPTAILAESIETEGRTAVIIFGLNYFMIALAAWLICKYAYDKYLVAENAREYYYFIKKTYGYSIIYALAAFLVCFVSITAAITMYAFMFLAFALPDKFAIYLSARKKRKAVRHKKNNAPDIKTDP